MNHNAGGGRGAVIGLRKIIAGPSLLLCVWQQQHRESYESLCHSTAVSSTGPTD